MSTTDSGFKEYFIHDANGIRQVSAEEAAKWNANPAPITSGPNRLDPVMVPAADVQAFFAGFAAEMRKPSYGDQARDFGKALLLRAQEAGLYAPET